MPGDHGLLLDELIEELGYDGHDVGAHHQRLVILDSEEVLEITKAVLTEQLDKVKDVSHEAFDVESHLKSHERLLLFIHELFFSVIRLVMNNHSWTFFQNNFKVFQDILCKLLVLTE